MKRIDARERFIPKDAFLVAGVDARTRCYPSALQKHEGYEVAWVTEGACRFNVEHRRYDLAPGDCIFLAEGEYHALSVPKRCRIEYLEFRPTLLFSHPALLERFLKPFRNGQLGGSHAQRLPPPLRRSFKRLFQKARGREPGTLDLAAAILDLVRHFERLKCEHDTGISAQRTRLRAAIDLIHRAYAQPLNVNRLARACAMSRSQFTRTFGAVFGQPPKAYLNDLRLAQARNLLLATDRKVADIASATGHTNLSQFNRAFLARYGRTPSATRSKMRERTK